MRTRLIVLALIAASGLLTGCQTSILKPESGSTATATVERPVFFGQTHIAVTLDGKTYTGVAGESHEDISGEQALRFGWQPEHKHRSVRHKLRLFFGTTILTGDGGEKLACDHMHYVEEWRLRCKTGEGKEIALYRVES